MRRRILGMVVAVTVVAVSTLFVPAALAIRTGDLTRQEVEVQRDAALAAAAISPGQEAAAGLPTDDAYGLYGRDGRLVRGLGPPRAEAEVLAALGGEPTLIVGRDEVVAALALADSDPVRVLRVAEPRREARAASARSIAGLGLVGLAIVAGAAAASWLLATRLARPVEALDETAARLDAGDVTAVADPSGLPEIDRVGATLARTGARIQATMERERAFSADASHQLRTPLTAMRAAVEAEQVSPRDDRNEILGEVLSQIERMDATLTSLLELARDTHGDRRRVDLAVVAPRAAARWAAALADAGREIVVEVESVPGHPPVSEAALDHALDVLLDNALHHGKGTVRLGVDEIGRAARVTVADEGRVARGMGPPFERRPDDASGTGIGLHLAQTLIEAEGGRLRLTAAPRTTFEVILPLGPGTPPTG